MNQITASKLCSFEIQCIKFESNIYSRIAQNWRIPIKEFIRNMKSFYDGIYTHNTNGY